MASLPPASSGPGFPSRERRCRAYARRVRRASPIRAAALLCTGALLGACLGSPSGRGEADPYLVPSEVDLHEIAPARNGDGTINVLVEIPAGTCDKWEVAADGKLRWELRDGRPRVVRYLGYPGNYGMIPRTLLPEEDGGDGDPLDVLLLGPAVERGALVAAHLIGVLTMLDGGERDDKLLAVQGGTPFEGVRDLPELEADFPGVTAILATWFASYKGPGEVEVSGFHGARRAAEILDGAERAYASRRTR